MNAAALVIPFLARCCRRRPRDRWAPLRGLRPLFGKPPATV